MWSRVWKISAGIAASLLIAFAAWQFIPSGHDGTDGILAFTATEDVDYVTLRTGKGNTINLRGALDPASLPDNEANIEKADVDELAYVSTETITTFDTHLVSTPRGKDYKITLEDGTVVWLNAESSLQYPSRFTGTTRHVHLKGEAYFKVAKNPDRQFIITTDRMDVRVLGTE
ncbi:MAG: FecR family protein, partial [Muribaculaceae bacterium]|nr:FecR family protein [Muribaculaceae bacterium]